MTNENVTLQPTMKLRWVETDYSDSEPLASRYVYGEKTFYKLQQWWQDVDSSKGEWVDITYGEDE